MSEGEGETKTAGSVLDPRRNVFRPDLAAKSLYGKVSAPNYAPGFPAQVARAAGQDLPGAVAAQLGRDRLVVPEALPLEPDEAEHHAGQGEGPDGPGLEGERGVAVECTCAPGLREL